MNLTRNNPDDSHCVHVDIDGAISQREVSPIHEPLVQLLGGEAYASKIVLNLAAVPYVDSSGINWLLRCQKKLRESGGRMVLHSLSPTVMKSIRVLKLDSVLEIANHKDDALHLVKGDLA